MRKNIIYMIFFIIFIVYGCEDLHKEDFLLEDNFVTQKLTRAKEQDYYWYKGQKVFMEKQNNKVFTLKEKSKNINAFKRELEWSVGSYETMKTTEDVVYTSNVYSTPKGEDLFFTNLFFVKLKETTEYSQLVSLATQNNVNILGHAADMDLWYKLECNQNSKGTAVEMANLFYETGLFQYSHPDLVFEVEDAGEIVSESTLPRPNDTYFNKQWHLYDSINNRDINFLQARQITQGDSTIKIAVIENGLPNFNHEDLEIFKSGNLVFSSYEESVQYTLGNTSQADSHISSHATACVGIIAATPNNNKGVTGIAPDCSIISIATGSTVSGQHYSVAENIARAFNIAQNNNAAVVSCSWYCSVTEDYGQDIIEDAISNIILQGRESKGSVVVFAAGNGSNSPVSYPANALEDIIVVGALDADGKINSESRTGPEIDIVAPSGFWTTYEDSSSVEHSDDNLYGVFDRTSSACPLVAGAAALVLSENPNLTMSEVTQRILLAANTSLITDNNVFFNEYVPNLGWRSDVYGFGVLDIYKALQLTTIPTNYSFTNGPIDGVYEATESIVVGCEVSDNVSITLFAPSLILTDGFYLPSSATFTFVDPLQAPTPTTEPIPNNDPMISINPFPYVPHP